MNQDQVDPGSSSAGALVTGTDADSTEPEKADLSQESIDRAAAQEQLHKQSQNGEMTPCFRREP